MLSVDDSIIWRRSNSGFDDGLHSTVGRTLDNPNVIATSETRSGEESEKDRRENRCRTHI